MWAAKDYKSCSLPPVDEDGNGSDESGDEAADGEAAEDEETNNNKGIQYVIGDVTHPQNTDSKDALIVHCVGQSSCRLIFLC